MKTYSIIFDSEQCKLTGRERTEFARKTRSMLPNRLDYKTQAEALEVLAAAPPEARNAHYVAETFTL